MTTNCIFQTNWFLDAAAPGSWAEAKVEREGQVIARLPYGIKQKWGMKLLMMPPFVHALGPWIAPSSAKYAKQLSHQKELIYELIEQLPPHDYFSQKCHYSFTNWLPFYWQGFTQSTSYTYILDDLTDQDRIWSGFQENIRREIRKAQKKVEVSLSDDIGLMYNMCKLTFDRQNLHWAYDLETFSNFDQACAIQQRRKIFVARDSQNRIHAAVYIVWDDHSAHYILGGSDSELRTSGAMSLLLWEAIQFAATVSKEFDFVGSMTEPIERFFRGFGAKQTPYFILSHTSRRMKMLMAGREMVSALRSK
jgi:hypothetical protein